MRGGGASAVQGAGGDGIEMRRLLTENSQVTLRAQHSRGRLTTKNFFEKISQSKIRWGVIKMTPDFYKEYGTERGYGHLSFGVEEEKVLPPVNGKYYA